MTCNIVIPLISCLFAFYVYFRGKVITSFLVEKLRGARNNLRIIREAMTQIREISDSKEISNEEKMLKIRELAILIERAIPSYMNTIDNGMEWGNMSSKQILKDLCRNKECKKKNASINNKTM